MSLRFRIVGPTDRKFHGDIDDIVRQVDQEQAERMLMKHGASGKIVGPREWHLIAYDGEKPVGFVQWVYGKSPTGSPQLQIWEFNTIPRARRRGIAESLLEGAATIARYQGRELSIPNPNPYIRKMLAKMATSPRKKGSRKEIMEFASDSQTVSTSIKPRRRSRPKA